MTEELDRFACVVVLADESAGWQIAGLRQLDRLVLALNELAEPTIDLVVFWRRDIPLAARWLPHDPRMKRVRVTEDLSELGTGVRVITTRLLVDRKGLREHLETMPAIQLKEDRIDQQNSWWQLDEQFEISCREGWGAAGNKGWQYLKRAEDTRGGIKILLRRSGKSQDGIVSRFFNRPLSRPMTHLLLKFPITPTSWTLAIFVLPMIAFVFLLRGGYVSIVIGCALYQLYSMLDGCDGEIARAKYLESQRGERIDSFCDMLAGFLFVIGLGLGLSRASSPHPVLYAVEGVLSAVLIAAHESLLRVSREETKVGSDELSGALYSRHRQLIEQSGVLFLGEKFVWWILQLTKRDVTVLLFLVLAVAGLAPWILHYSVVAAAVGLGLSALTSLKTRGRLALSRPPS